MTPSLVLDLLLLAGTVLLAYRAIHAPVLFTGVVLYITFGLFLSLLWVRLGAPDVAIAEAAIGAGITGALLLDTAGRIGTAPSRSHLPPYGRHIAGALSIGLAAAFCAATLALGEPIAGLGELVGRNLAASGADHPVTAVLLDFRGYDTFLEVVVLLAAGIAAIGLRRGSTDDRTGGALPGQAMIRATAALLLPFAIVASGYLVWKGAYAPGGAFQAGAVMGAAGVLFILTRPTSGDLLHGPAVRALLALGCVGFLAAGLIGLAIEGSFLAHPPAVAGMAILLIELAVAVSVAATLGVLFVAVTGTTQGTERAGSG